MGLVGCPSKRQEPTDSEPQTVEVPSASAAPLDLLYLPDGGDRAPPDVARPERSEPQHAATRCPADMVDVGGRFCIDRYEAVLEDAHGRRLSPYYHPTPSQTRASYELWERKRHDSATAEGRAMPVPVPPPWQLTEAFDARAVSVAGEIPHGYQSGRSAAQACRNAGKRLCTEEEWVKACRGEAGTQFPYGEHYEFGRCNVFRATHPAAALHGNPAIHHLDPRLNRVSEKGRPLLRPTGTTPDCRSRWGDDAVYDMVGNLAEWVADEEGVFVGGFYARDSRDGCDRKVSAHAYTYFDYSLGVRCCR
jgi:sulfatase modifying factor 1